ncbi:MAG: H-NS histone family protein [Mangrovicoccus sp.]|nr:H-NS histone family protein [Mangrovicoccus sp.]
MQEYHLDELSLDELQQLQKAVGKAIETLDERRRKEALASVEAKAREMGFSLAELTESLKRSKRSARPARYRHPENPDLTWSGRGRHPAWVKDAIENGANLEDFEIKA